MVLTRDGENANLTIHDVLDIPIMDACPCNHPDPTYNGVLNVFEMQRGISNLISSCLARLNKLVSLYLFRVLVFSFSLFMEAHLIELNNANGQLQSDMAGNTLLDITPHINIPFS